MEGKIWQMLKKNLERSDLLHSSKLAGALMDVAMGLSNAKTVPVSTKVECRRSTGEVEKDSKDKPRRIREYQPCLKDCC